MGDVDFVDMKTQREDTDSSVLGKSDEDYFPLSLYLGKDEIAKLGLGGCKVGDEKVLVLKTRATSVSESENEDGNYQSLSLTIKEAKVLGDSGDVADDLYGGD